MKLHLILILFSVTVPLAYASSPHDIAELMMQKQILRTDGEQFTIFYRFSILEGAIEGGTEDLDAKLILLEVDPSRTSLVFHIDNVKQTDLMSVRFPFNVLSAEEEKFIVLADDQPRGYELSVHKESTNIIFILPENTAKVEIIGTSVVPEFGSGLLILGLAVTITIIGLSARTVRF
ncbi:hypothetical protein [Candidatus Nitrosotenuis uzonensis]|uniref:PEFG-CTERM sorting domain-containing protein n=1 Tax=Candidatus Nitrosotenuis uzonensis TaxID=1407055 RepID=A0A812F4A6_9ARCH|nr:hypothetical protein [Candidatus Nitrosotenuis uzonensis]CAE6487328.1 conserved exported hypothetical protein [Candidatus Nitrosotenuis uzonensis]